MGVALLIKIFAPIAVLILFFQNCSSEPAIQNSSPLQRAIEEGEFPYEVSVDQIAYMSCSQQNRLSPDRSAFFTFRMGAYGNAGLALTPAFIDSTSRFPADSRLDILSSHVQSDGAQLRVSVRSNSDLRAAYTGNGSGNEGQENFDYSNIFPPLGDRDIATQLLQSPEARINTNVAAFDESEQSFEGDLRFYQEEADMEELRSVLNVGEALLALTMHDLDLGIPRGPLLNPLDNVPDEFSVAKNAFGMGFRINFSQPFAGNFINPLPAGRNTHINVPRRIMTSVQEVQLGEASTSERRTWICPQDLRYRIVSPQDASALPGDPLYSQIASCATNDDPITLGENLSIARRSLRAEDWWIDQTKNCIVPKPGRSGEGACYGFGQFTGTSDSSIVVNHDFTTNCGLLARDENGFIVGACPHFVSICIRQ